MLPYFQIKAQKPANNFDKMYTTEIPQKPKRSSKSNVPVHKTSNEKEYKIFSGNVTKPNRSKHDLMNSEDRLHSLSDEESKLNLKLKRRYILKENEKLCLENQQLNAKIKQIEEYFKNDHNKLKEALENFKILNTELVTQNTCLKSQCEDLRNELEATNLELEKCRNCENCRELTKTLDAVSLDLKLLRSNNLELVEDTNMLKNVVYRLNVQLECYQEKLSNRNVSLLDLKSKQTNERETQNSEIIKKSLSETHWNHAHSPVSWGKVNGHTLGPLLDAYQETIKEKEDIILDYEAELSKFTVRMKDVIKENELLHKRLNEDSHCSKILIVQIEQLKHDLNSTKEQNDLLIKKCALKQGKVEEILKCFEQKVDQMKRDYSVLHEQYGKSRNEVVALKEKNRSLVESHEDFKKERDQYIPLNVHKSSVEECKKWYEELKAKYEFEKSKLLENKDALQKDITKLNEKISIISSEKQDLENKVKQTEKQVKKWEVKCLDLQHAINEVQVSRSACRKQLHKAMSFAKDMVGEQETLLKALNQRHLENKVVKKLGSDIACRMDSLKSQLKSVQKDAWQELSTVEQRLLDQNILMEKMEKKYLNEIGQLKQIIKEKDSNLLFKENISSVSVPRLFLYKDRQK